MKDHVEHYIANEEMNSKDAIKKVATDREMVRREVYQKFHIE